MVKLGTSVNMSIPNLSLHILNLSHLYPVFGHTLTSVYPLFILSLTIHPKIRSTGYCPNCYAPEAGEVHPNDGLCGGGGGLHPRGDLGALLQHEYVGVRTKLAGGHEVVLGD